MIVLYVALGGAVFATVHSNNLLARSRADRIIVALQSYKDRHGVYPQTLADLVPDFMSAVPIAKYTVLFNEFRYYYNTENHDGFLLYTAIPPFGKPTYRLKTKTWLYLD